ncbi:MAG TPA: MBL fold metallo-hydrolase [Vicinamibacterales bacterium]|nr:MBL fold metallo-hydrolase [Vicinamibacterales bacterium]
MRRFVLLSTLVTVGLLSAALSAYRQEKPKVIETDKLAENLYVLRGGGGNTAVFVTADGVTLVDTKLPGWGQPLLEAVKRITDRPVTRVINTHTHFDHTNGQVEFPDGIEIVAHENTKTYMEQANPVYGLQKGPQPNPFKDAGGRGYPTRPFKDTVSIGSGAGQVDVYHFGPAHTGGDAFIVFPALRVMHAGDVFPTKDLPIMDLNNGGSGLSYAATLEKAAALANVDTIVNGHAAKPSTKADLEEYAAFIRDFVSAVQEGKQAGRTLDDVVKAWQTPARYAGYADPNPARVRANAEVVWKEVDNTKGQ